jgi:predicted RecA/RadA family phage recombinase
MPDATFVHGNPLMVDYTPSANVDVGDVVVVGGVPHVAHVAIPNGVKGAVSARNGVYRLTAAGNYSPGNKVYWNATASKITTGVGSHPHFGFIAPSSDPSGDGQPVDVIHVPDGSATSAE